MATNPIRPGYTWIERYAVPAGTLAAGSTVRATFRWKRGACADANPILLTLESGAGISHSITGGGGDDILQVFMTAAQTKLFECGQVLQHDFRVIEAGGNNDVHLCGADGALFETTVIAAATAGEGYD